MFFLILCTIGLSCQIEVQCQGPISHLRRWWCTFGIHVYAQEFCQWLVTSTYSVYYHFITSVFQTSSMLPSLSWCLWRHLQFVSLIILKPFFLPDVSEIHFSKYVILTKENIESPVQQVWKFEQRWIVQNSNCVSDSKPPSCVHLHLSCCSRYIYKWTMTKMFKITRLYF